MYLGQLINAMRLLDPEAMAPIGITHPHSWRGDYSDLAFEPAPPMTNNQIITALESAIGKTFNGYKGGEYQIHEWSQVHLSFWGESEDYWALAAISPSAVLDEIHHHQ